jgi:hypothetical protein
MQGAQGSKGPQYCKCKPARHAPQTYMRLAPGQESVPNVQPTRGLTPNPVASNMWAPRFHVAFSTERGESYVRCET